MGRTVLPFPHPTSKTLAKPSLLLNSGNSSNKYLLSLNKSKAQTTLKPNHKQLSIDI